MVAFHSLLTCVLQVVLFACTKYYKTRLNFLEKCDRDQSIAMEHFSCAGQPALEDFDVSGHKIF